jgi:hypothetical protein
VEGLLFVYIEPRKGEIIFLLWYYICIVICHRPRASDGGGKRKRGKSDGEHQYPSDKPSRGGMELVYRIYKKFIKTAG